MTNPSLGEYYFGKGNVFRPSEHPDMDLPDFARRLAKDGEISGMQQAYTRDGELHGNGVIVDISILKHGMGITVITEAGNIIWRMNMQEFNAAFKPGKYILKDFPTTESAKAWKEHYDSA